jgi:phage portal protein BeeE
VPVAKLWRSLLGRGRGIESRYLVGEDYFSDFAGNSLPYLSRLQASMGAYGTGGRPDEEDAPNSFSSYVQTAYKSNGVVFAVILARLLLFTEARFQWQRIQGGKPGDLFGNQDLAVLEQPWPNGTTGELLARMEQDASLAGNFYCVRERGRLRRLRPDWVTILLTAPPDQAVQSDVAGYAYWPGGYRKTVKPQTYLPEEMCHWSPIPDPEAQYRGMSWLAPAMREVAGDSAATSHKLNFFRNGATPQIIVTWPPEATNDQFDEAVQEFRSAHVGVDNAYRPLFFAGGADAKVIGADLKQLDFKVTQGAGETRLCAAGGVPAVIVGLSEGLQAATYSNFSQARRKFGDHWARPQWRSACAALQSIVPPPSTGGQVRLWYDDRDIAFLREDARDAAEIEQIRASTIVSLATGGFTRKSSIAAAVAQNMTLLEEDPNWVSVQLQQSAGTAGQPAALPAGAGAVDAAARAIVARLAPLAIEGSTVERKFNPDQPRSPHSGEWVGTGGAVGAVKDALKLSGKIDLDPNEKLVGSSKIDGDFGNVRLALTEKDGNRLFRLGLGGPAFGTRHDDAGPWRGGPDSTEKINAEREKLRREEESLQGELDSADPARRKAIEKRLDEIDDMSTMDADPAGYTARLDQSSTERLRTALSDGLDGAEGIAKKLDAYWNEHDRLEAERDKLRGMSREWTDAESKRWDDLTTQLDALGPEPAPNTGGEKGYWSFAEGSVPGDWADIHYSVIYDDGRPEIVLGAVPHGSDLELSDLSGNEQAASLTPAELRKFLGLLGRYARQTDAPSGDAKGVTGG